MKLNYNFLFTLYKLKHVDNTFKYTETFDVILATYKYVIYVTLELSNKLKFLLLNNSISLFI